MANETTAEVMTSPAKRVKSGNPYTPEETKQRFLLAASRLSLGRAIQIAPWKSVGLALSTGYLLGYCRPLRQGIVALGKLSLKGMITVISHLGPHRLAGSATSTVTGSDDPQPDPDCSSNTAAERLNETPLGSAESTLKSKE